MDGLPRIYADFNGLQGSPRTEGRLAIALDTIGSVRDLAKVGLRLADGTRLVVYDWSDEDEDLEANVTTFYDPSARVWLGELDESGYCYVPAQPRTTESRFLCLQCRSEYAAKTVSIRQGSATLCHYCGSRLDAPIAPPDSRPK
jgi:DNA-directed RNA polymerase subunit RPC12/RpoP